MTREEIRELIALDPELVCELILTFQKRVEQLEERIKQLENEQTKDSHNSSKPPSRDSIERKKKTQSLRKKSQKNTGGQKGHRGSNLKMVEQPDHLIPHKVEGDCDCGRSLKGKSPIDHEKRQVFDLPDLKLEVTEHRAEIKVCECGRAHVADFPEGVNSPTQYGHKLKALISYLMVYQHLPYERTAELLSDMLGGHEISQGTLYNTNLACYDGLENSDEVIKEQIIDSDVVNVDETGASVNQKKYWLHSASTPDFTYYACHPRRGSVATDEIGILPTLNGTVVHDFWKSYLKYGCKHGLCNAHHLRNLTYIFERYEQPWAQNMINLLLEIKETVDRTKIYQDHLEQSTIRDFENSYRKILQCGYQANPPPKQPEKPKRGRAKKGEPLNLLERFDKYANEVLAFMYDFKVPFDNNLAERDLRMMKLHLKISGSFRSEKGAEIFCRIRSYISSVKKQKLNVLDALTQVFQGQPLFSQ